MSPKVRQSPDDLLLAFQNFQNIANQILRLIHISLEALQNNDLETTDAVLNQKQGLIQELSHVREIRDIYEQSVESNPASQCPKIDSSIKEIDSCLQAIRQAELETIELARQQHQTMATNLQAMVRSQAASKSYQPSRQPSPSWRIDISG